MVFFLDMYSRSLELNALSPDCLNGDEMVVEMNVSCGNERNVDLARVAISGRAVRGRDCGHVIGLQVSQL